MVLLGCLWCSHEYERVQRNMNKYIPLLSACPLTRLARPNVSIRLAGGHLAPHCALELQTCPGLVAAGPSCDRMTSSCVHMGTPPPAPGHQEQTCQRNFAIVSQNSRGHLIAPSPLKKNDYNEHLIKHCDYTWGLLVCKQQLYLQSNRTI